MRMWQLALQALQHPRYDLRRFIILFLAFRNINGKLFLRQKFLNEKRNAPKPTVNLNNVKVNSVSGPLTIVLLDMTWSERAYWIQVDYILTIGHTLYVILLQAKTKLLNLMTNASGKIYTAAMSPFASTAAIFKNKDQFRSTTLSLLNEQANNARKIKMNNSCLV